MKIIAGKWRGFSLKHPERHLSRPTQERVKKSLFDILGPTLKGSVVLDLFSGSGSLGIEALSREAKAVTFVEKNPICMKLLKENLSKLPNVGEVHLLSEDAFKAVLKLSKKGESFDIIFMDPPYTEEVTTKYLRGLGDCDILSPNAVLVARHAAKECLPPQTGHLRRWREEQYGPRTQLSFYRMMRKS